MNVTPQIENLANDSMDNLRDFATWKLIKL